MAFNKICSQCRGTGSHPQMKQEKIQAFVPGVTAEVIKHVCPYCGYTTAFVDNHGVEVTAAEKTALIALTGLGSSLVEFGRVNISRYQVMSVPEVPAP